MPRKTSKNIAANIVKSAQLADQLKGVVPDTVKAIMFLTFRKFY